MDSQRRYQVFVSSTYRDLKDERDEVVRALLELDCFPTAMELFPASDDDQWSLITRLIDSCDYYIVIVGGRYGSTDADGLSYTEKEYDYAVSRGIPVLGFVHASPDDIPTGKTDIDAAARQKLDAFRAKVQRKMCKSWTGASDLGSKVSRAVTAALRTHPRPGWVRTGEQGDPNVVERLRARIETLEEALDQARTSAPPGTQDLASGEDDVVVTVWEKATMQADYAAREVKSRWNDIFGFAGPVMFSEAAEREISSKIASMFDQDAYATILDSEVFDTIKVQWRALGLITQSPRKHVSSDSNTYWSLTPYGETVLTRLRAVRKTGSGT